MIAGHFGLAAGIKSRAPTVPLWALMFATVWLDIVFVPLFLTGVETIQKVPLAGAYGGGIIHADYSHSLVGAALLSAALAALAARIWDDRTGLVIGIAAFSHWALDLIVHRHDLPFLPGNLGNFPLMGLGLWQAPAWAAAIEMLFVAGGSFLYWHAARRVTKDTGHGGFLAMTTSAMTLLFGGLLLFLDVSGMAG